MLKSAEDSIQNNCVHWKPKLLYKLEAELIKMVLEETNRYEDYKTEVQSWIHRVD